MHEEGLDLPECKRPNEATKTDDPKYCPYHRVLGHKIEDCWSVQRLGRKKIKDGLMELAPNALQEASLA